MYLIFWIFIFRQGLEELIVGAISQCFRVTAAAVQMQAGN